jgi:hypothetical protein
MNENWRADEASGDATSPRPRPRAGMRLKGLRQQRELRCWSLADLARATGLTWPTVAQADAGAEVSAATARKIRDALEANPPSATALHMFGQAG